MSIKKLTAIILSLVMATGSLGLAYADTQSTPATAKDYNGHWAESTIQKWIDEGKINGYPDGSFRPDNKITRAEFVQLVNNSLVDYTSQTSTPFTDVKTGDWYLGAVNTAFATEYIKGYSQTQFGPTKNINREQAAAIMSRIQYLADNTTAVSAFSDSSNISSWAVGQVGAATNAEFVKGYNGKFNPLNNLTRAEAVTMLDNVLQNGKNEVIYKAGTELKDTTVEGDLIIAKTVGDGDVRVTNVEVKGTIKVYGGGANSVYFNNVKVARIEVEKDKVRLVLENGTTVQELSVGTEAKLENLGGTVATVTIDSTGKVTLAGDFQDVQVISKTNVVLDDAKITNLVVEQPISILGTGTIATLTANADGIQMDSTAKATKTELGTGVTEKPEIISGGTGGPGGPGPGTGGETSAYTVTVTANSPDGLVNKSYTKDVTTSAAISDVLLSKMDPVLSIAGNADAIQSLIDNVDLIEQLLGINITDYLGKINTRLNGLVIGSTPLLDEGTMNLNTVAWDKLVDNLSGTYIGSKLANLDDAEEIALKAALNGGIQVNDLAQVLPLYSIYAGNKAHLESDFKAIVSKLADNNISLKYNENVVTYSFKYKAGTITTLSGIANLLDGYNFSTMTVEDFYNTFGNVTVGTTAGGNTATTTITVTPK